MNDQSDTSKNLLRISIQELQSTLTIVLLKNGFTTEKANICAQIFVQNTCEGSTSHGISRFPRFIQYIKNKHIDVRAEPECKKSAGSIEQWDGHLGPGPLNAIFCTRRAMEIQMQLLPLHKVLFIESNPIPVKWAVARMGRCKPALRLPLTPLTEASQAPLEQVMQSSGLL